MRTDGAEDRLSVVIARQYEWLSLTFQHEFVYGVVACPVNEPIGVWRCIACSVLTDEASAELRRVTK